MDTNDLDEPIKVTRPMYFTGGPEPSHANYDEYIDQLEDEIDALRRRVAELEAERSTIAVDSRVRLKNDEWIIDRDDHDALRPKGTIGTVIQVIEEESQYAYCVQLDGGSHWLYRDEIEIVDAPTGDGEGT